MAFILRSGTSNLVTLNGVLMHVISDEDKHLVPIGKLITIPPSPNYYNKEICLAPAPVLEDSQDYAAWLAICEALDISRYAGFSEVLEAIRGLIKEHEG